MGRAPQKSPASRRLAVVAAVATGLGLAAAGCSAGQVTQTDTQVAAVNGASGTVGTIAVRDAQLLFPVAHGYYEEGDNAPVVVLIANNGGEADKLLSVTSDRSAEAEITGDKDLEPGTAISGGADQDDAGSHQTTTSHPASSSASATSTSSSDSHGTSGTTTTTTTPAAGSTTTTTTSASGTSISGPPTTTRNPSASVSASAKPSEPGKVKIVLKDFKGDLRPGQTLRVTFLFEKAGPITLDLPIGATPEPRKEGASEH
ncbi:copper chaperone PCu(A)C [Saccharothrix variisporea]|uniref:Copper(I)-binding protein n=1 Tax=Saccharothrix variisporea TaxID=543527 RepID=A0A495XCW9_9PSEU|nr:hypothetical protein [Saccharothrix variisporea]RKT71146.1 hypothetical protein DFJ66_4426 [Saccharothrix variisporea]